MRTTKLHYPNGFCKSLVSEEKFLQQIYTEEQFGTVVPTAYGSKGYVDHAKSRATKAAIGYNYEDNSIGTNSGGISATVAKVGPPLREGDEESDEDVDFGIPFFGYYSFRSFLCSFSFS